MGIDARMFVKVKKNIKDSEVSRLAYEFGGAVGPHNCCIFRTGEYGLGPHGALSLIDVYEQDGPSIEPAKGEKFIEAHLMTRYYGPGYERGDIAIILLAAEWLERRLAPCEVWYGGDSSGVCATLFDTKARKLLLAHWVKVGHAPYQTAVNRFMKPDAVDRSLPTCKLCGVLMSRNGYGDSYGAAFCYGCGHELVTNNDGKTWHETKEE